MKSNRTNNVEKLRKVLTELASNTDDYKLVVGEGNNGSYYTAYKTWNEIVIEKHPQMKANGGLGYYPIESVIQILLSNPTMTLQSERFTLLTDKTDKLDTKVSQDILSTYKKCIALREEFIKKQEVKRVKMCEVYTNIYVEGETGLSEDGKPTFTYNYYNMKSKPIYARKDDKPTTFYVGDMHCLNIELEEDKEYSKKNKASDFQVWKDINTNQLWLRRDSLKIEGDVVEWAKIDSIESLKDMEDNDINNTYFNRVYGDEAMKLELENLIEKHGNQELTWEELITTLQDLHLHGFDLCDYGNLQEIELCYTSDDIARQVRDVIIETYKDKFHDGLCSLYSRVATYEYPKEHELYDEDDPYNAEMYTLLLDMSDYKKPRDGSENNLFFHQGSLSEAEQSIKMNNVLYLGDFSAIDIQVYFDSQDESIYE